MFNSHECGNVNEYSSDVENVKQKCDYFQFKLKIPLLLGRFFIKSGEDVLFPILARLVYPKFDFEFFTHAGVYR